MSDTLPKSIAIAGGWGYIGQLFVKAAHTLGITTYVYDPGPRPKSMAKIPITLMDDEEEFYALSVDMFYLALHPNHRDRAFARLLARAERGDTPLVLMEKPMATPEDPDQCRRIIEAQEAAGMNLFYDFLELFEPLTARICDYLNQFEQVDILEMEMMRSKDRENPANPRNRKIMVPIQYQESVHCIAYILTLLGRSHGGRIPLHERNLSIAAQSEAYAAPNPVDYPYVVDGKCEGTLHFGDTKMRLLTNFKTGAPVTKRRVIRGVGDGIPFTIEAEYQAGHKYLRINGEDQGIPLEDNAYTAVIQQVWEWRNLSAERSSEALECYPLPRFTRYTYLLSALLWDACDQGKAIEISNIDALENYAPTFPDRVQSLPKY